MSKIQVMSMDLSNKIAAGEVIEKTMNVVKELVENSIDAGATTIKIDLLDSGVGEIIVTDDGVGMDEEKLAALNRKLGRANDSLNSSEEEKGGIALVNVNNRIHLIFGDEYGMHVYSVPQRGTDVEITIPLTENDREVKNRSVLK